jgi:hypothetical protein
MVNAYTSVGIGSFIEEFKLFAWIALNFITGLLVLLNRYLCGIFG